MNLYHYLVQIVLCQMGSRFTQIASVGASVSLYSAIIPPRIAVNALITLTYRTVLTHYLLTVPLLHRADSLTSQLHQSLKLF